MKKIIIMTVAVLCASVLFAQKQSTEIKQTQLPEATLTYIKSNLPGCQITKATKVVEAGKASYDVVVDVKGKKNLFIFDGAGAFLKRGEQIPQTDLSKPAPSAGSDQKIVPVEQDKPVQQKEAQPSETQGNTKKIAQPEPQGTQTPDKPKSTQQTAPQGVKSTGDKKVAQPTGSGGTKKIAQPVSTGSGSKPATKPPATGSGTKPAAQPASTKPASTGAVKPASSGAVQQTGSKDVKQTGTTDKKVAQPASSGDLAKPK